MRSAAAAAEHLEVESGDRQAAIAAVRERLAALHHLRREVGEGSPGGAERAARQQLRALADCRCGGKPARRGPLAWRTATWSGRAAHVSQLGALPVRNMFRGSLDANGSKEPIHVCRDAVIGLPVRARLMMMN